MKKNKNKKISVTFIVKHVSDDVIINLHDKFMKHYIRSGVCAIKVVQFCG